MPNYSFEDTNSCVPFGNGPLSYCQLWINPTLGTPDYYNTNCSPVQIYQYARTGFGMSAIFTYQTGIQDVREYLQIKLVDTLEVNKRYCVSFYVTLNQFCNYGTSSIGAHFSSVPISQNNINNIMVVPQILNPSSNILADTVNWINITGSFVANGTEAYLTIGNFFDDANSDTTKLFNHQSGGFSYYYIDDVNVIECVDTITPEEPLSIPNVFTPNGDGINDLFEIKGLRKGDKVSIYNRWGTKVFYNINERAYWDGYTTSGEPCSNGTYFYTIDLINGERKSGYVQLQR